MTEPQRPPVETPEGDSAGSAAGFGDAAAEMANETEVEVEGNAIEGELSIDPAGAAITQTGNAKNSNGGGY